ncbi:MAG: hypothetical protein J6Y69_11810, partial [Treponema sp.]|nr:hypothetical protein [Treponema sp.]
AKLQEELDKKTSALEIAVRETNSDASEAITKKVEEITSDLMEKVNNLELAVEQKTKKLEEDSNTQILEYRDSLLSTLQTARETAAELEQTTIGNTSRLDDIETRLQVQVQQIQQKYDGLFDEAFSRAEQKETSSYEKYKEMSVSHLNKYKSELQVFVSDMQKNIADSLADVQNRADLMRTQVEDAIADTRAQYEKSMEESHAIAARINEETTLSSDKLANFDREMKEQFNLFDENLSKAMKSISMDYENKQSVFLAGLDKQLDKYKQEMDYRFNKLNTAGADVDKLEDALRKIMDQAQKRVLGDFEKFTTSVSKNHVNFETSLKSRSDKLKEEVETLEVTLEELKEKSYTTTSSQLKVFEDTFTVDLKKREEAINQQLNEWKNKFDTRIENFTNTYEESRRDMETRYADELKNRINEIQTKTTEQESRFQAALQTGQSTIENQINTVNQRLHDFIEQYRAALKSTTEQANAVLKQESDGYNRKVTESLAENLRTMNAQFVDIKSEFDQKYKTNIAVMDETVQNVNEFKTQITRQLKEANEKYEQDLQFFMQKQQQSYADIDSKTQESRQKVQDDIDILTDKAEAALKLYEDRSGQILQQLQKRYEAMVQSTQGMLQDATGQADRQIKELKHNLKDTVDADKQAYQRMIEHLNDDTNALQIRIDEINKGITRFTAQTGLFDKADQLKKQLNASIDNLQEKINGFASYEVKVNNVRQMIEQVQQMSADIDNRISNFNVQKNQLDSMDQKFNRLLALSNSMDDKIAELNVTNDKLVNMQVTVRNFQDSLNGIQAQYDRIETKAETIEKVANNVDSTADRIHDLERRLSSCNSQLDDLPGQLEELQDGINIIMKHNENINQAVDKLSSLQQILDETEERMDALNETKSGIQGAEERLQELAKSADKQIAVLQNISRSNVAKKKKEQEKSKKGTGITPQLRDNVKELKRRHWTNEEIANSLGISEEAVELILEIPSDDE